MQMSTFQEPKETTELSKRGFEHATISCRTPIYHAYWSSMVMEAAKKRNAFPAKHGASKHYSPYVIVEKKNLDWEKHCKFVFGEYVQAVDDPDNTSTIKLAENGKQSCGKRTRHFDIKLFYVTDLISRDELQVKYCPTDDMVGDYMTKPLVGIKFHKFRKMIMNLD